MRPGRVLAGVALGLALCAALTAALWSLVAFGAWKGTRWAWRRRRGRPGPSEGATVLRMVPNE